MTLVLQLAIDYLSRLRRAYGLVLLLMVLIWIPTLGLVASQTSSLALPLGISLMLTFGLGPGFAFSQVAPNASFLPVSRQDLWRAQWAISVLGPAAAALVTMGAALLFRVAVGFPAVTPGTAVLLVIYHVAYAGLALGAVALFMWPKHHLSRHASNLVDAVLLVFSLGFFAWGYAIAEVLPFRWSDVDTTTAAYLLVAFTAIAGLYAFSPKSVPRPRGRTLVAPRRQRNSTVLRDSRLTGFTRLLAQQCLLAGATMALMVVVLQVLQMWFETSPRSPRYEAMLSGFGAFLAMSHTWLRGFARSLKVLPIGAAKLTALFTALPLLRWLVFLVVISAASRLRGDQLQLPIEIVIGLAGFSVVTEAVFWRHGYRWSRVSAVVIGLTAISVFVRQSYGVIEAAPAGLIAGMGLLGVGAGLLANYHTVTRSHDTFKPRRRPLPGS